MTIFTAQAVSPTEATYMAMGFGMGFAELSDAAKSERDWGLAASLDKKADAYYAAGNVELGKVCRTRALNAANRAVRFSKSF
jgi:hypothetical protein